MHKAGGSETRRTATISFVLCTVIALLAGAGCEQWARMEDNQIKMQAMVAANARQLATISSQLHTGQGKLNESLQDLDQDTQEVTAEVLAVQNEQRQLQDALVTGNKQLNTRLTQLEANQHALQGNLTQVADVTGHTASELTALAGEHATLHETVRANQQELTQRLSAVADGQQRIQTGVTHLQQAGEELAGDVTALADRQNAMHASMQSNNTQLVEQLSATASDVTGIANQQTTLHGTVQSNTQALTEKLTALERNQQSLRSAVDGVAGTANRTAADVTGLAAGQSAMQETLGINQEDIKTRVAGLSEGQQNLQAGIGALDGKVDATAREFAAATSSLQETLRVNREVLTGQMAAGLQNQQAMQNQLNTLTATTSQTTLDIADLDNGQAGLNQTIQESREALTAQVNTVTQNQQALGAGIDNLAGKTDRISAGLVAMAAGQETLQKTLVNRGDEIENHVALLAERQETFAANLDILMATSGQTALDVIATADRQDVFSAALQNHDAMAGDRMGKLADSQEQIRSSLDIITATTGQASLDVITLANGQAQLGQAVQTNRQELTNGLATLAQNQQNWLRQFEATQATAKGVTENLTALEGRLADLQAIVQTSGQDITARLGTNGQQRGQFETQVSQDIQVMLDAVAQLRQVQAALQEQMTQVQKNTESQTQNIKAVIEQIRQPPAELKVSDAGKAAEAPVAQGAE